MTDALGRPKPVELSHDPRFAGRIRRLAATSVVALGVIWALAALTLETSAADLTALAIGWALMPTVLVASLAWPSLRYLLVVPATSVTLSLLAIVAWSLPPNPIAAMGWLLVTGGVALGGVLGLWFWYRLAPVPASLDHPFSPARIGLIAVHVALVVVGIALAAFPQVIG